MALIDFLLKNWFIVVILLALFAQFAKKTSGGGSRGGAGKGSMPTFGGDPGVPGRSGGRPVNRPVSVNTTGHTQRAGTDNRDTGTFGSAVKPSHQASKRSSLNDRHTLMESGRSSLPSFLEEKERPVSPFSAVDAADRQVETSAFEDYFVDTAANADQQINKKHLAQGIIWAEILGPPRAKKPFRR